MALEQHAFGGGAPASQAFGGGGLWAMSARPLVSSGSTGSMCSSPGALSLARNNNSLAYAYACACAEPICMRPSAPAPPDLSLGCSLSRFSDAVRQMKQTVMLPSRLQDLCFAPPPPPQPAHRRHFASTSTSTTTSASSVTFTPSSAPSSAPLESGAEAAQSASQLERERRTSSSSESGDSALAVPLGAAGDAGVLETLRDADLFDVFLLVQHLEADLQSGAPRLPSPSAATPQLSGAPAEVAARVRAQALALQSSLRELTAATNAVLAAYAQPAGSSARP